MGYHEERFRLKPSASIKYLLLGAISVVSLYLLLLFWLSINPPPESLDHALRDESWINPVDATDDICANEFDCVEAWKTDLGVFMRFNSSRKAEFVTYVLGSDSRVNGNVVVDFSGKDLSFQQKQDAIFFLYPGKDWY